ncbi:MAG: hypothetical protein HKP58_08770 [Desulfatitalea sp.]|nr:hypothetical protein [Desulfatitalea sp.]NNK00491.1 hypothetical protein [Desulfatitalea sp.]
MQPLTLEELQRRRLEDLRGAELAIRTRHETYQEIKRLVRQINDHDLDVSEYYTTARRLGSLLGTMTEGIHRTIFHYFAEHIDPHQSGDVRCFRMECRELAGHLRQLDQWRADMRRMVLIK